MSEMIISSKDSTNVMDTPPIYLWQSKQERGKFLLKWTICASVLILLVGYFRLSASSLTIESYMSDYGDPAEHLQKLSKYDTSPRYNSDAKINLHLVPHTHDDVGWLTTVDNYFTGSKQHMGYVQTILDTAMSALERNPDRKFMYVEIAFFMRWWSEQSRSIKRRFKRLVESGQFVFVSGGWSMNDEATVHYGPVIDQMTLGHQFLISEFGVVPKIGWQIDPFGHSNAQAELFAEMGFEAFFMGRIDQDDIVKRRRDKTLEFMWHPSKSKPDLSILGLVLYDHYGPPDSLNLGDGAEPVNDDSTLDEYNIKEFVDRFVHAAVKYAESSITTNVLFPMGEDFCYRNSEPYYKNMDKIIHYMKKDGRVNAFYSNPEIYVDAVKKETKASKHEWLQNNDDFFPYSHNPHSYWTGYFTSRPAVKRLERQAMNVLMACRQAEIFTSSKDEFKQSKSSSSLRLARAMAIVQHHDGVSGTEKQFVAEDYTKRLSQGVKKCEDVISRAYFCSNDQFPVETARNNEMEGRESDPALLETCLQATNTSICAGTERAIAGAEISVVVYNPLGFIPGAAETAVERTQKLFNLKDSQKCRTQEVRLPVSVPVASVSRDGNDNEMIPFRTLKIASAIQSLREDRGSATHEVVFDACVRPLAFSRYLIKLQNSSEFKSEETISAQAKPDEALRPGGQNDDAANLCNTPFRVSNGIVTVEFENMKIKMSCTLGVITHIAGEDGEDIKLQQEFMYYESNNGSAEVNSPSGAYIFRPVSQTPEPIEPSNELKIVEGSRTRNGHLLEVRVHINPWLSQIIRPAASTNEKMLDVSVVVGPIPVAPSITESSASATQEMSPQAASPWVGKEVIVRYTTDIKSKGVFYTDANGREMQRRVRDHRENWPLRDTEPVSRNYYPINTRLSIRDEQMDSASKLIKTLNLYTDRSVGGSSISDGQIELMIHRRCLHDDYLGVGDPLDEPGYVSYPGWKQTSDCKADGVREPENDKDVTSILSSDISGFCACDETHKVKFDCGHESTSCADACPSSPKCRFRRTGGCDPHGPREPAGDTDCDATIIHGMSGFCECDGDYTVPFTCDHGPIKCKDACLMNVRDLKKRTDPNHNGLIVNNMHRLHLDTIGNREKQARYMAMDMAYPLVTMVTNSTLKGESSSLLKKSLPENIHLQSLEILRAPDVLLVRFENIMTTDENGGQNDVVCFNVRDVFNEDIVGKIVGAQEVSLTANTKKERYYLSRDDKKLPKSCPASTPSELLVALAPMEIVTLELQVA